jgi:hypothetical protein
VDEDAASSAEPLTVNWFASMIELMTQPVVAEALRLSPPTAVAPLKEIVLALGKPVRGQGDREPPCCWRSW